MLILTPEEAKLETEIHEKELEEDCKKMVETARKGQVIKVGKLEEKQDIPANTPVKFVKMDDETRQKYSKEVNHPVKFVKSDKTE